MEGDGRDGMEEEEEEEEGGHLWFCRKSLSAADSTRRKHRAAASQSLVGAVVNLGSPEVKLLLQQLRLEGKEGERLRGPESASRCRRGT